MDETAAQPGEPRIATNHVVGQIPIADQNLKPFICILVSFQGLLRSTYYLLLLTTPYLSWKPHDLIENNIMPNLYTAIAGLSFALERCFAIRILRVRKACEHEVLSVTSFSDIHWIGAAVPVCGTQYHDNKLIHRTEYTLMESCISYSQGSQAPSA